VLGRSIGFPESHEGSGFGAALLGMEALGIIDSIDVAADHIRIADVVAPDEQAAATYQELLPRFEELSEQ
jgi:gluconokinase